MSMRVGIIGTGWGVNVQVPMFRAAGLEISALYSRDKAKAEKLCSKLKIPHAFDSVEQLVACPDVDLVSVVSPTYLHAEHAIAVLRGGKHLLSDKPMACTASEAQAIVAEAQARPAQIAIIDHEVRFNHFVQAAREVIAAGALGTIRHVTANFMVNMGGLGKNYTWWHDRKKGGGVSGALGVHVIDLCRFISGQKIATLSGKASTFVQEKPVKNKPGETAQATADDAFSIVGSLDAGGHIQIFVSGVSTAKPHRCITVVGEVGSIVIDLETATMTHTDAKGKPVQEMKEPDMNIPDAFGHGTVLLAKALAASEGRADASSLAPACSVVEGAYVQSVIDAMWQSSDAAGAEVSVGQAAKL